MIQSIRLIARCLALQECSATRTSLCLRAPLEMVEQTGHETIWRHHCWKCFHWIVVIESASVCMYVKSSGQTFWSWLSILVSSTSNWNHIKSCILLMSLWPNRKPVSWNSMSRQNDVSDIRNFMTSSYRCRSTSTDNNLKKVCRCGNDVCLAQLLLCGLMSWQTYWIWSCPYISRIYKHTR